MTNSKDDERHNKYVRGLLKVETHAPVKMEDREAFATAAMAVADEEIKRLVPTLRNALETIGKKNTELRAENEELHRYHAEDRDALTEMRATIERTRSQRQSHSSRVIRLITKLDHVRRIVNDTDMDTDDRQAILNALEAVS